MPNSNYVRGRAFEYQIVKHFRDLGYEAFRTAGSHGKFDVVAVHPDHGSVEFIQCKVVSSEADQRAFLKKFKKDPPLRPLRLPPGVHQWMVVKMVGQKKWESVTL